MLSSSVVRSTFQRHDSCYKLYKNHKSNRPPSLRVFHEIATLIRYYIRVPFHEIFFALQ